MENIIIFFLLFSLKDNEENKRKRERKIYRALHRLLWPPSPWPPSLSLTAKLNSQTQPFDCAAFMAHDTPSTTPPLIRPSRRWFSSFRLKTTLSVELGGSVGDLGTYIPIVLTLTLVNHLDLSTTLIFTALYNISIGFLFSIPMPVQPMKSIAVVAISDPLLSLPQIVVASLSTAATLFIFGATNLMSLLYRFIPLPVVRGVQLSQAWCFALFETLQLWRIFDLVHLESILEDWKIGSSSDF